MALVVKNFFADTKPNANGNYVEIAARQSGLIAWLLSLVRIDPTYFLDVSYNEIVYRTSDLSGYRKTIVTSGSVSSSFYGYHKPIKQTIAILLAFLFFAYIAMTSESYFGALLLVLIGLVVAVVYYVLNKQLHIGFSEINGDDYAMILKPSVIEGKAISEDSLKLVTDIISTVLRENRNLSATPVTQATP